MSRFEYIGNTMVNVDHIECIEQYWSPGKKAKYKVRMVSGEYFWADAGEVSFIAGRSSVKHIIPCENTVCLYKDEETGEFWWAPVRYLAVTENGEIRPIRMYDDYFDFADDTRDFVGLTPKTIGICLTANEIESDLTKEVLDSKRKQGESND